MVRVPVVVAFLLGCIGERSESESVSETPAEAPDSRKSRFQGSDGLQAGRVLNPTSEADLSVVVDRPVGEGPFPVLIVAPGGTRAGDQALPTFRRREWVEAGFAVVTWDPDGRGTSEGQEDRGGHVHQDGLKAVIEDVSRLPQLDGDRMGLVSLSYGVVMASGLLARYLDEVPVHFLIDWEGPADRYDLMECASDMEPVGGRPLPPSDISCDDAEYWSEREAVRFIPLIQVPYFRIQSTPDHKQPDVEHARQLLQAAVNSGVPEVWLNGERLHSVGDQIVVPEKRPPDPLILDAAKQLMESATGRPVEPAVAPPHLIEAEKSPPGPSKGPSGRKRKRR